MILAIVIVTVFHPIPLTNSPSQATTVYESGTQSATSSSSSQASNKGSGTQSSTQSTSSQLQNPVIQNGSSDVSYPSNYQTLANYALGLINADRASNGQPPVTLSSVASAQQHADSMLYFGYFSHWDTQGYKPYMRYTLLGGTGAVQENIGQDSCTDSQASATEVSVVPCTIQTIQNGINNSEWNMMYNDVTCCNNGHRDNILDPLHNEVSIGIAYSTTTSTLYFVEDFQNDYIALSGPISSSTSQITIAGSLKTQENVSTIGVYYDSAPKTMNVSQLDATSTYGPGTLVGGVLPPCVINCAYYPGEVTVYASSWQVSANSISIDFSLNSFVQAEGAGVYTVYVQTGDSTADSILTYSIFVI